MSFHAVYYIVVGAPSFEKTLEMVDKYIAHGVTAIQLDMPARDPYGESAYIQAKMRAALERYPTYELYMDVIRTIRRKYPKLEIHLVVYPEVIDEIGMEKFADYCREIGFYSVLSAKARDRIKYLNSRGVTTSVFINADLPDSAIENAKLSDKHIVMLRNRKDGFEPPAGIVTCGDRLNYIRSRGVTAPVFFVQGITSREALQEVRDSGCNGAYVGSILMKLWDDEAALWKLLDAFQSVCQ